MRSPSKYGHEREPAGARLGGEGQAAELVEVDAQQPGDRVEHARRVQGRHERQEVPARVGEARDRAGRVDRALLADTANTVPDVPIETTTSPGWASSPSAAPALSPAPGPTRRPSGSVDPLVGPEHARQQRVVPERRDEEVAVVAAGRGVPVAGARGIRSVGHELVEHGSERRLAAGPKPRRRQVSQSCGSATAATRAAFSGSWSRSQRSFVIVNDATGTRPVRCASVVGAELRDQVGRGAGRAGVVPQQRGTDDATLGVEHDHAVLLPADRPGRDVVECRRRSAIADLQGVPPGGRVDLGAVRVRGTAGAHDGAGRGIRHDDLAGLRRRVDAHDECHVCSILRSCTIATPSAMAREICTGARESGASIGQRAHQRAALLSRVGGAGT